VLARANEAREILRHRGLVGPGRAFGYLGWAGQGNLGDDLMYEAHRRMLRPTRVTTVPVRRIEERLGALSRVPGGLRIRAMLLGGGTLFGRPEWWRRLEAVRSVTGDVPWTALGVGVEDETFESDRTFVDRDSMRRWAEFASTWPVFGVRGPRSREILAEYGVTAQVTGDPALVLAADAGRGTVQERLLGVSLATPEARWGDARQVGATLDATLDRLRAAGWRFRIFIFSRWDRERAFATRTRLGDAASIFDDRRPRALLDALSECHLVLGERLHSVVMAATARTPVLAVEYRPKIRDFMLSLDREQLAIRADRLTASQLVERVVDLAAERDAESRHLAQAVDALTARLRAAAAAVIAEGSA
jgi:polysaccharide pyruvyl transferase WcaK-like protein